FRYNYARGPQWDHPYPHLVRLHARTTLLNFGWMAAAALYLLTTDQAAPFFSVLEGFVTQTPAIWLFSASLRVQLNPIDGISLYRRIQVCLTRDPYQEEIR